ncbi:uncharacterized protein AMSG_08515 [Thecamonas trahens ATCC 50062]|uniref:Sushi domain-containing protein n=1 Tax=Thecamonas trahens ATCC 50062 TaxID=461836 RepID=A0A0L0DKS9_THETB|nr:hypothetical protein AMSG_08515 [Thecamonas trahens ATCC 50062]KNC52646.1 hypothetical protein AMSG_08515 [Thecamonas trahens ATCC 50062]|eukprot:XP_013755197.1 hypothetical protein AMSG_08515 [Thecamonas trahens ATCC 50062]
MIIGRWLALVVVVSLVALAGFAAADPSDSPFICGVGYPIDAAVSLEWTSTSGSTLESGYVFKGSQVWAYSYKHSGMINGIADEISNVFPGVPTADLDAVAGSPATDSDDEKRRLLFFKEDRVWKYDLETGLVAGYPRTIATEFGGYFPDDVHAAETERSGPSSTRIRVFRGSLEWVLYFNAGGLDGSSFMNGPHGYSFSPQAAIWTEFTGGTEQLYFLEDEKAYFEEHPGMGFNEVAICASCDGDTIIATGTSGTVAPFVADMIVGGQTCTWLLRFYTLGTLTIDFDDMSKRPEAMNIGDSVLSVYEGADTLGTLVATYDQMTSPSPPFTLVTTASEGMMYLKLVASATGMPGGGFSFSWSFAPASATVCPTLTSFLAGTWAPVANGREGDVRTASCEPGWTFSGTASRTCLSDGMWSGSDDQACAPRPCNALVAPVNGVVSAATGNPGDTVTFSCNVGYTLTGYTTRTCQSNQLWSNLNDQYCNPSLCGTTLSPPANGMVSSTTGHTDETVSFSCGGGYYLQGSSSRTCRADGTWSNLDDQVCVGSPCTTPAVLSAPANGVVSPASGGTGTVATFSCNAGYTLTGTTTRTCLADGSWSGSSQMCSANACNPPLSAPDYGTVDRVTGTTGDVANYGCNAGYSLSGGATRVCTTAGTWSGAAPTCVGNPCAPLPAPTNGRVDGGASASATAGGSVVFSCNTGYQLSGASARTCLTDGSWDGVGGQTCTIVACGPAQTPPANGVVSSTLGNYGDVVTFSCNSGYTLGGYASRTCLADGTWSNLANQVCFANTCSALLHVPTHGNASPSSATTGQSVTFSCGTGYYLSGSSSRVCQPDGTWSGTDDQDCLGNLCTAPMVLGAPVDGTVAPATGTTGDAAVYSCNAGYTMFGVASRTCLPDGSWTGSGPPTCLPNTCSPPRSAPAHGSVDATSGRTGEFVTNSCDAGYDLVGSAVQECLPDGSWSNAAPSCVAVLCPSLTAPVYGLVDGGSSVTVGTGATVTFSCLPGYALSGSVSRTCLASGVWSGAADQSCTSQMCATQLVAPDRGTITCTTGTTGTTCSYGCNAGFVLEGGSPARTCQGDGSWSGSMPSCAPSACVAMPALANGRILPSSAGKTGDKVTLVCDAGYVLTGIETQECMADGTWSGGNVTATCVGVVCGPELSAPTNGGVSCTTASVGESCAYTCDAGYTLSGSSERTCMIDGRWTGSDPRCTVLASSSMLDASTLTSSTTSADEAKSTYAVALYLLLGALIVTLFAGTRYRRKNLKKYRAAPHHWLYQPLDQMLLREHPLVGIIAHLRADPYSRTGRTLAFLLSTNLLLLSTLIMPVINPSGYEEDTAIVSLDRVADMVLSLVVSTLLSSIVGSPLIKRGFRSHEDATARLVAGVAAFAVNIVLALVNGALITLPLLVSAIPFEMATLLTMFAISFALWLLITAPLAMIASYYVLGARATYVHEGGNGGVDPMYAVSPDCPQ